MILTLAMDRTRQGSPQGENKGNRLPNPLGRGLRPYTVIARRPSRSKPATLVASTCRPVVYPRGAYNARAGALLGSPANTWGHQNWVDGTNVVFPGDQFGEVAASMKARRWRRQSEEARRCLREAGQATQFQPRGHGIRNAGAARPCVPGALVMSRPSGDERRGRCVGASSRGSLLTAPSRLA